MKLNSLDLFIFQIEENMKILKIKKSDLHTLINRQTVTKLFSQHKGSLDSLRKVVDYVEEIQNNNRKKYLEDLNNLNDLENENGLENENDLENENENGLENESDDDKKK